jgi:hypothetical protein
LTRIMRNLRRYRPDSMTLFVLILAFICAIQGDWMGVLRLAGFWVGLCGLGLIIMVLISAPHRRDGEAVRTWIWRGPNRDPADHEARYYYAPLSCGHQAQIKAFESPQPGEVMWCPGHRRLGPARMVLVESPSAEDSLFGYSPRRKSVDARREAADTTH